MTALPPAAQKAAAVQAMFDRIAPRYDRVNRLLTFNADQRWRKDLVRRLRVGPDDRVLDLACGTGDFAMLCRARGAEVVGLDFSRGMLVAAAGRNGHSAAWVQGDGLHLPVADASFTAAVSGFALRNFVSIQPVFEELARVLKRGSRLGLLEVDAPRNRAVKFGHGLYFDRIVPVVGGLISDRKAYQYLPQSAAYLPPEPELLAMLEAAGFSQVRKRSPMFGAIQSITAVRS